MTSEKKRCCLDRCAFFGGVTWNSYSDLPRKKTPFGRKDVYLKGKFWNQIRELAKGLWKAVCCKTLKRRAVCFLLLPLPKTSSFAPRNRPKPNRKSSITKHPIFRAGDGFFGFREGELFSGCLLCQARGVTPLKMGGVFLGYRSTVKKRWKMSSFFS